MIALLVLFGIMCLFLIPIGFELFVNAHWNTVTYFYTHLYDYFKICLIFALTIFIFYKYIKWANKGYMKERQEEVLDSTNMHKKIWTFLKLLYKMLQGIVIWFICMVIIFAHDVHYYAYAVRLERWSNIFGLILLVSYLIWLIQLIKFEFRLKEKAAQE